MVKIPHFPHFFSPLHSKIRNCCWMERKVKMFTNSLWNDILIYTCSLCRRYEKRGLDQIIRSAVLLSFFRSLIVHEMAQFCDGEKCMYFFLITFAREKNHQDLYPKVSIAYNWKHYKFYTILIEDGIHRCSETQNVFFFEVAHTTCSMLIHREVAGPPTFFEKKWMKNWNINNNN